MPLITVTKDVLVERLRSRVRALEGDASVLDESPVKDPLLLYVPITELQEIKSLEHSNWSIRPADISDVPPRRRALILQVAEQLSGKYRLEQPFLGASASDPHTPN